MSFFHRLYSLNQFAEKASPLNSRSAESWHTGNPSGKHKNLKRISANVSIAASDMQGPAGQSHFRSMIWSRKLNSLTYSCLTLLYPIVFSKGPETGTKGEKANSKLVNTLAFELTFFT